MLRVQALTKGFGGRTVLRSVSFVVNSGTVAGVVGPNGSGKTTLLRCLLGELPLDSGSFSTLPGATIGYLAQGVDTSGSATAGASYPNLFGDDAASARLAQLAARLGETPDGAPEEEFDAALRAVERSRPRADMASESAALGLRAVEPEERVAGLSGGERTKLGLLNCLASRPDLLLLDEPTNHLDLPCIEWLEALLRRFRGPVLVVSHDRALLDAVASQTVSIDARSGEAESFVGDYSAWADDQARREAERWERYRREQRKERRQRQVISSIESQARQIENTTIHFHYRKRAKKVARKSTVLRDRLQREFDRGERTARPQKKPHGFYGDFQERERGAARLLSFQRLGLSVGGQRLLEEVSFDVSRGERVVLMGGEREWEDVAAAGGDGGARVAVCAGGGSRIWGRACGWAIWHKRSHPAKTA